MRDVAVELKGLRLYGMASAWSDLTAQGGLASLDSSRWLIEHLLQAESTDRAMRSISYQMKAARFPIHRDLAGFDFAVEECKVLRVCPISRSNGAGFFKPGDDGRVDGRLGHAVILHLIFQRGGFGD